jgi:hypothetical protein
MAQFLYHLKSVCQSRKSGAPCGSSCVPIQATVLQPNVIRTEIMERKIHEYYTPKGDMRQTRRAVTEARDTLLSDGKGRNRKKLHYFSEGSQISPACPSHMSTR